MRKLISTLLTLVLICSIVTVASADSLIRGGLAKDSAEFYTIGNSVHTFQDLYDRMHVYLDLQKYPIPEPTTTSDYSYVTGQHDEFTVLKDDDDSYDYIGYVCNSNGARSFIIWSWSGYHEDGTLIGVDSYYALNGVYLGAVKRDYTTGAISSSGGSPFALYKGTIDKN